MDKFTFNFGASEPDEEITPPPTQLAGVIFSFVPAPASELTQMEKDYQNYLQEWEDIKKLSTAQQADLLQRSSLFIRNVKPGQFNIDKFADKIPYLYNNMAEDVKEEFYKQFKAIIPRRFPGLELDLENKLTSKNHNELEYGLILLSMFFQSRGADTNTYLTKYVLRFRSIVDAHLSGSSVISNDLVLYLCLGSITKACRFLGHNFQALVLEVKELLEKVIEAVVPLQNYPSNAADQKLWWKIRIYLFKAIRFFIGGTPRRKIPDSVVEAYLGLLDYFVEKKIEISPEAKESAGTVLMELSSRTIKGRKRALDYWDLIILPGLRPTSEVYANVDQVEQAAQRIREDEDIFADMTSMGIISHLLGSTLRSKVVNNIIAALNSTDVLTKCAGLKGLTEIFPKANYERDQLDKIIKITLIPGLDDSYVGVRALCCRGLSTLNSKSKAHLDSILPSLTAKLFDLLAHDKFYVKYYAIKALSQFAVKLSGERLIESLILESHIREILAVNKIVPLPNVAALLKSDVFVNHAPMFLKDTLMRACDFMLKADDDRSMEMASDYFTFAKDIFMSDRVVASQATLQAIEPIMVQFMEHPVFSRSDLLEQAVLGDFLDVLGFATYHIPLITKEFWDAFRVIFNAFERVEIDLAEEFFVPIGNYIARAPEHFLQIPNGVAVVLDKINNMNLGEDVTGWEFVVEVLASVGKANSALLNGALDIAIKHMMDGARSSLLLHIFRAIWTAMYVDARVTLQKLDAKQPNWWKRWMAVQPKTSNFGRVGKKIVALGMISLISLNMVVDVPKSVASQTEGFVLVFKQLIPLLTSLQDFESIDYIAPISQMEVTAAESVALRAEASANKRVPAKGDDSDIDFDDEDEILDFHDDVDDALQQFDDVHEEVADIMNVNNWDDDDGDEDGVEEFEDESKSALIAVDELMLLVNARKSDPSKFETILGALDEEERLAFEEHLKRVKIGPKSLLDQAIEFVGRHYERYETDPNMKRLNRDVVERINKWLVTPQPLPEK